MGSVYYSDIKDMEECLCRAEAQEFIKKVNSKTLVYFIPPGLALLFTWLIIKLVI